jgi:hypothetical protein
MNKHYYTYQDLMELLSCTKRTLERKISKMNIKKRYLGGGGKPYFLVVDIHSFMLFNKSFNQCNQKEQLEVKELINNAV